MAKQLGVASRPESKRMAHVLLGAGSTEALAKAEAMWLGALHEVTDLLSLSIEIVPCRSALANAPVTQLAKDSSNLYRVFENRGPIIWTSEPQFLRCLAAMESDGIIVDAYLAKCLLHALAHPIKPPMSFVASIWEPEVSFDAARRASLRSQTIVQQIWLLTDLLTARAQSTRPDLTKAHRVVKKWSSAVSRLIEEFFLSPVANATVADFQTAVTSARVDRTDICRAADAIIAGISERK